MSFEGGSPGISVEAVLASAPIEYARSLLGERTVGLLDLIEGGTASHERLRAVAASAVEFAELLAEPSRRDNFLAHLPETKVGELRRRLGRDDGKGLEDVTWTPTQSRELLGFLGLLVERVPEETSPDRLEVAPSYGLFPHQRRAIERVIPLLYDNEHRVVLHLPTGVGKTRTAMYLIAKHLREREPTVVAWLAHGSELLEQASEEFERAWAAHGDRPVTLVRAWGSRPVDLAELRDGLVVFGLEKASAARRRQRGFLDRLALIATLTVFDEAHQSIAATYRRIVDALTLRPDAGLLGLTATPGRTWADIGSDEELANFYGRNKVTLEIEGHTNPVTALIEQGYLARPTFRTVATKPGVELSAADEAEVANEFDLPDEVVRALSDDAQWNLKVVQTVLDLVDRHRRVLVFAASVAHCRLLAAVISSVGVDCEFVAVTTPTRRRETVIRRFKGPGVRPMVLCNFGVLTAGFDAPAASAAVIARPTRSLVLFSQMVGRVIRGPLAGGTDSCEVVTVVDPELPGFGNIASAFENWEDVWEVR